MNGSLSSKDLPDTLAEFCTSHHIKSIGFSFSGSGDSGDIDDYDITTTDGHELDKDAINTLHEYFNEIIETFADGYEDNEGGCGKVDIDYDNGALLVRTSSLSYYVEEEFSQGMTLFPSKKVIALSEEVVDNFDSKSVIQRSYQPSGMAEAVEMMRQLTPGALYDTREIDFILASPGMEGFLLKSSTLINQDAPQPAA